MGGLRQTSKLLQNLGNQHIITGKCLPVAGVFTISECNDPTLTVADAAGNPTLTFAAFNVAPVVLCSYLKATHSATVHNAILVEAVSTTTAEFRTLVTSTELAAGSSADPANGDGILFMIVGTRDN